MDIPLHYTARILFRHDTQIMDDHERLGHLDTARGLVPSAFSGGWLTDEPVLADRRLERQERQREEEERDPELKEARSRPTPRRWMFQTLVFVWLGTVTFLEQLAARAGLLAADRSHSPSSGTAPPPPHRTTSGPHAAARRPRSPRSRTGTRPTTKVGSDSAGGVAAANR